MLFVTQKQKINKTSLLGMVKIQTDSLDYFQHVETSDRESRMTLQSTRARASPHALF